MHSLRSGVALLLALPALTVVSLTALTAAPAHAAPTSFTWTGLQDTGWGNPQNWSPSDRAPENGDSVSIGPAPRNPTNVPDVSLASLSVTGSPDGLVSMSGEGTVTAQQLLWQGGNIDVDLVVGGLGAPPSVITPMQTPLRFGSGGDQMLTVLGSLSVATGTAAGTAPWLSLMFDSSIHVTSTGTLSLDPAAWIQGNRCCTSPTSSLVVDGTVELASISGATGQTARLDHLGLDLNGTFDAYEGNTVELVGGPVRASGALSGGGTFQVTETDGDSFDPDHPDRPDGTFKLLDDLTLADGTVLGLGQYAELSGAHRIVGDGSVRFAGATIYGEVSLAATVPVSVLPGPTTRVAQWDDDVVGQRGVLTATGGLSVATGASLQVDGGARVVVPDGATLRLPGGSTLTSGGCCTDPGRVTVQGGGTIAVGGGSTDPAVLRWVELGGAGRVTHAGRSEWDLAGTAFTSGSALTGTGTIDGDLPAGALTVTPTGVLKVTGDYTPNAAGTYVATLPASRTGTVAGGRVEVGGTARLAGRIRTRGATAVTSPQVLALKAGSVSGTFRCAETPGYLPAYAARSVSLRPIDLRASGCLVPSGGGVLAATYQGRRTAPLGVPSAADRVLLDVTLGRAPSAHRVTLSGGRGAAVVVRAAGGRSSRAYVVVSVAAARRLTATTDRRASVRVVRVGWY